MVTLGLFETILQFLRTYTLSHTTNRMDVELGQRLRSIISSASRSPISRPARPGRRWLACARLRGQSVSFLTGQGLTSLLDLVFTIIFFVVMFIYSVKLSLVVLASDTCLCRHRQSHSAGAARTDQREVQPRLAGRNNSWSDRSSARQTLKAA